MKRGLFILIGLVATLLGILGVWLPGVPTTIFILIAMWAFSRSSHRLEIWIEKLPILKQAIKEAKAFQDEGTVSIKSKIISQLCAWLSFILVAIAIPSPVAIMVAGGFAISCTVFMWWVPTRERTNKEISF